MWDEWNGIEVGAKTRGDVLLQVGGLQRTVGEVMSGIGLAKLWTLLSMAVQTRLNSTTVHELLLHAFGAYNEAWVYDDELYEHVFGQACRDIKELVAKKKLDPPLPMVDYAEAAGNVLAYKEKSELAGYMMATGECVLKYVDNYPAGDRKDAALWIIRRCGSDLATYGYSRMVGRVLDVLVNPVGLEEPEYCKSVGIWELDGKAATRWWHGCVAMILTLDWRIWHSGSMVMPCMAEQSTTRWAVFLVMRWWTG